MVSLVLKIINPRLKNLDRFFPMPCHHTKDAFVIMAFNLWYNLARRRYMRNTNIVV
jgi:hypothetical protein